MALGYDGKLYILAFDHRGSFQKKMFGIEGDPDDEQTKTIADAKHLIYEGMAKASEQGTDAEVTGVLVDEQFGGDIPRTPRPRASSWPCPSRSRGQNEFDFEYGDDFGDHIERFDPDFSKVLVRYNPDGDAEMNQRQTERLKRLADWLHENDRKFLFELLVPAEDEPAREVGGDTDRYDAELRPELMRRTIVEFQDDGVEADIWKIEGVDAQEDCETHRRRPRAATAATAWSAWCWAAAPTTPRSTTGCARARRWTATWASRSAARSGGTRSRASSTGASSGRKRPSRSPATTCTSSTSTSRAEREPAAA